MAWHVGGIEQGQLTVGGFAPRCSTSLDETSALLNWAEVDRLLAGIPASATGEPGWPLLAVFRALLPARTRAGRVPAQAIYRRGSKSPGCT